MLSHAEVEAIRLRGNEDVDALMTHIDALEAFRARVLAVARRLRAAKQGQAPEGWALNAVYAQAHYEAMSLLLALAEEAGNG